MWHWVGILPLLVSISIWAVEPVQESRFAIRADRLLDVVSDEIATNAVVIVEDGLIAQIATGEGADSIIEEGMEVLELGDRTLMPGMIDTHVHLLIDSEHYQTVHLQRSSAENAIRALLAANRLLQAGWTGIRIAGDADSQYAPLVLQKLVAEGVVPGPRITAAGHYISATGGGGDALHFLCPCQKLNPDGRIVDGPEEMRKEVRTEINTEVSGSNFS